MTDSDNEEKEYIITEALYNKILEKSNDDSYIIDKTKTNTGKKKFNHKIKQNILLDTNVNTILNERKFNPRSPPYKLK